jgi:nicotinamidase-related amidase
MSIAGGVSADEPAGKRTYENHLKRLSNPRPILADYPEFVEPVHEVTRYEAPILVDEPGADLEVRAWRFSYNARGIVEMPNRLRAGKTALIVVHPWGIDDGQGWRTPEPAGVADFCTPIKNAISHEQIKRVLNPFLKSLRGKVAHVMYSQPGNEDPIRKKLYRSFRGKPTAEQRRQGAIELDKKLNDFAYKGQPLVERFAVSTDTPVIDYFKQFPGLDATAKYNNEGFWALPIPVVKSIDVHPDDVLIYDSEGYPPLRDFLQKEGVRHVLLTGYATDMCYCKTTAGYENLSQDFNVFLVGDATMATFPANSSPRIATNAALSFASLKQLVTQISWIRYVPGEQVRR